MNYACFVKGVKLPASTEETKYTRWQVGARKVIERAFGNLKILWKFVLQPIEIWNLFTMSMYQIALWEMLTGNTREQSLQKILVTLGYFLNLITLIKLKRTKS